MVTPTVTFNYSVWVARYPEFANVGQPLAQAYFDEAGLYFANAGWTGALPQAAILLNMLTAHVAWLYAPRDDSDNPSSSGQNASPLVGRISSAAEGSVNVSTELTQEGGPSEGFFSQSKYGLSYWQATSQFRTAHYVVRPRFASPLAGSFPFFPRGRRIF